MRYRVWCKDREQWEEHSVCIRTDGQMFHLSKGSIMPLRPDTHIVSLFTGLKDAKGNEIYEGDIVTALNGAVEGVVIYQAPEFVIKRKPNHKSWFSFTLAPEENQFQTVIGNIYENPELLK